jgi:LPS export ABC transporter protein LptC
VNVLSENKSEQVSRKRPDLVFAVRPLTIITLVFAVLCAVAVGWIYEASSKKTLVQPELEIPTDIDFFLSQMKYRVFNKTGSLNYQLQSAYLEHFIKDDISRIQQPLIHVYREGGDWQVEALSGDILHQQEWLRLDDNVLMQKMGADSIQVRSDSMLFKPDQNLVAIDAKVTIESDSAKISGDNAVFDLGNESYSLKNTRAIYYHADS